MRPALGGQIGVAPVRFLLAVVVLVVLEPADSGPAEPAVRRGSARDSEAGETVEPHCEGSRAKLVTSTAVDPTIKISKNE